MKAFLLALFLLICYAPAYAVDTDVEQWSRHLLKEKSIDTSEFYAFADTCIRHNKITELINTYRAATDAGTKEIRVADLRMFGELYRTVDTNAPAKNDFYSCYYLTRIYIMGHLDSVLPFRYASASLSIAKKLNDDELLMKAYSLFVSYYLNIKHDLLNGYAYIEDLDQLTQHSKLEVVKEGVIYVYTNYAGIYYYLDDPAKGIEFMNKTIGAARYYHKDEKLFNAYKQRSYLEIELDDMGAVLRTMDTAWSIGVTLPNKVKLLNYVKAIRFNAYEKAGRYKEAREQSKLVDIDNLKGDNDDYYDYLYHLVRFDIYQKQYDQATHYIDIYMSSLKAWNLQRLRNIYELKYILSKETHDVTSALRYHEIYNTYNDSVHHSKNNSALIREQIKFQTLQKDEDLKLEKAENRVKVQTIRFIIVGSVTIVLLLLLLLAYRINKGLHEKERLNREFAQQLIQNTEREQNRLANELHDGLGQELLLLKHSLVRQNASADADAVAGIIESVRGMARELYPALLDVVGLKAAIENQLQRIDQDEQIFVASELEYEGQIDKYAQLQLFRIFQEAVTNILKYANATSMYIGLAEEGNKIKLVIKDNGVGFNVSEKQNGKGSFGLVSMQKRADAVNGILKINSTVKGTEITITIPKDENSNS